MEGFTMNEFKLKAPYNPTGDQPQAIAELVKGFIFLFCIRQEARKDSQESSNLRLFPR